MTTDTTATAAGARDAEPAAIGRLRAPAAPADAARGRGRVARLVGGAGGAERDAALGAARGDRLGRAAVAPIGAMGVPIAFNGVMNAVTDSAHAPQAAAVAAGAFFAAWGVAMTALAVRDLRR